MKASRQRKRKKVEAGLAVHDPQRSIPPCVNRNVSRERRFWSWLWPSISILRIQARLAALLLGVMIFLWLLMLHIPRAIADPSGGKGNEWTSVFKALALSGIAFLLGALPLEAPLHLRSQGCIVTGKE